MRYLLTALAILAGTQAHGDTLRLTFSGTIDGSTLAATAAAAPVDGGGTVALMHGDPIALVADFDAGATAVAGPFPPYATLTGSGAIVFAGQTLTLPTLSAAFNSTGVSDFAFLGTNGDGVAGVEANILSIVAPAVGSIAAEDVVAALFEGARMGGIPLDFDIDDGICSGLACTSFVLLEDAAVERISAVPLPAGALLLGTALAGMGLARRR